MLYALGFIGLFTIGGLTGLFLAALGRRRPRARHLLRRRALPLHHGRRHGHGLPRRPALLVAEDDRAACTPRCWGKLGAAIIFVGFNLTFFPQFVLGYLGMPRRYHAYPPEFQVLNVLSTAGASILGVGYLLPLIYLIWSLRYGKHRRLEPVGRRRPRVEDDVAAADRQLRRDADRHLGGLRLSRRRWSAMSPDARGRRTHDAHHPALAHHFDNLEQQHEAATLGMWVFLVTEVMFFGGLFAAYIVYRSWYPDAFAAASHELDVTLGAINTVVLITSSLTMALAVHAAQLGQRKLLMTFLVADDGPGRGVPRDQERRVLPQVRRAPRARARLPVRERSTSGTRRSSSRSTS